MTFFKGLFKIFKTPKSELYDNSKLFYDDLIQFLQY